MRQPEDPARLLSRRIRAEHVLSRRATWQQLLHVCEQRGAVVVISHRLIGAGYYLPWPIPLIIVRWNAGPHVLAHELYHHLIADNEGCGIVYCYPDFTEDDEEAAANRFARYLCGPERNTTSLHEN